MERPLKETFSICSLNDSPRVPFKFDGRILYSSDCYELVHLTLLPGEGMELHAQPFDVVFFVIEGNGTLAVGNESLEAGENTAIHVGAGVMRAWLKFPISRITIHRSVWNCLPQPAGPITN